MTSNLEREGRLTIALSLDGGMCELRLRSRRLAHSSPEVPLAFFEAEVETVRHHVAPYATVTRRNHLLAARSSSRAPALAKADRRVARGLKAISDKWGKDAGYQDLREFLSVLEQEQQLLRITEQVMPEPDLAAAACALTKLGEDSPAIYFDNIAGYSDARVAMNVHGSWPNHALALGMDKRRRCATSSSSSSAATSSTRANWSASTARPGRRSSSTRT